MSGTPNVLVRSKFYGKGSKKRPFYSSADSSGDFLKYVDKGGKAGKYADFMDYAGSKEKSSGAFSKDGLLTFQEKEKLRGQLQKTDSVIWDMVISFEEGYGKEKMATWRNALDLIKAEFPAFLKANHIPYDKVVFYAGLHTNTDNRHIHLSFFESEPTSYDPDTGKKKFHYGYFSKLSLEDFKVRIEQRLDGHEYAFHQIRDKLLTDEDEKLKKPDMRAIYDKDLKEMLLEAYRQLPTKKAGYESHDMDAIRPEIDRITTYMMTDETSMASFMELMRKLKKRDEETRAICLRSKIAPDRYLLSSKFHDDLYRRCGNKILAYLYSAKGKYGDFHKGTTPEERMRWDEKVRRGWLFSRAARLNQEVDDERIDVFAEFERLLAKAEHDRLVEEGVIEAE
jgi:hypothetical protein